MSVAKIRLGRSPLIYILYWSVAVLMIGMIIGNRILPAPGPLADDTGSRAALQDHGTHATREADKAFAIVELAPENAPKVSLNLSDLRGGGFLLSIELENFLLIHEDLPAPNDQVSGHGHLYLNGEQWARLYTTRFFLPSMPLGTHHLRVTLNSHDHRAFSVNGNVIAADLAFAVLEND